MTGTDLSLTLPNGASPLLDEAVWQALLAVAGPDASWLVRQVGADLSRFAAGIAAATAARDAAGLRAAGHALAGLAGTIGAATLRQDAERMNTSLHAGAWAEAVALAAALQAEVARLTDDLQHCLAAMTVPEATRQVGA